jgi:hypothetical protein
MDKQEPAFPRFDEVRTFCPVLCQRSAKQKHEAHSAGLHFGRQSQLDPDDVFGNEFPKTCDLEEIFGGPQEMRKRYRHRTSSGNWTKDKLMPHEEVAYKKRMGFYRSPSKR